MISFALYSFKKRHFWCSVTLLKSLKAWVLIAVMTSKTIVTDLGIYPTTFISSLNEECVTRAIEAWYHQVYVFCSEKAKKANTKKEKKTSKETTTQKKTT